jgi:hypothetical protein
MAENIVRVEVDEAPAAKLEALAHRTSRQNLDQQLAHEHV